MRSSTLLSLSLSLLTTSTVAIPFAQRADFDTMPTESQTRYMDSDQILGSLITESAKETSNLNTCPPTHPSKQCCMSITALASDITSEIGEVVPLLSDVKLSSLISLECRPMDADGPNEACLNDVMCCTGTGGEKSSLLKTCKSWDEALESKKKALNQNINQQMMKNNGTKSSAIPAAASDTPTPSPSANMAKKHGEMVHEAAPSAPTTATSPASAASAALPSESRASSSSSESSTVSEPAIPSASTTAKADKKDEDNVDGPASTDLTARQSTIASAPTTLSSTTKSMSQEQKADQPAPTAITAAKVSHAKTDESAPTSASATATSVPEKQKADASASASSASSASTTAARVSQKEVNDKPAPTTMAQKQKTEAAGGISSTSTSNSSSSTSTTATGL